MSVGREGLNYIRKHLEIVDRGRVICPICGKKAEAKFFNRTVKKWVYKHPSSVARGGALRPSKYCGTP